MRKDVTYDDGYFCGTNSESNIQFSIFDSNKRLLRFNRLLLLLLLIHFYCFSACNVRQSYKTYFSNLLHYVTLRYIKIQ